MFWKSNSKLNPEKRLDVRLLIDLGDIEDVEAFEDVDDDGENAVLRRRRELRG